MNLNNSYIVEIKDLSKLNFSETRYFFEVLEVTCCYIIYKTLINNTYNLNITYKFETYSIDNAARLIEFNFIIDKIKNDYEFLCHRLETIIEYEIDKFHMFSNKDSYILNIDLILLNTTSILISFKTLKK